MKGAFAIAALLAIAPKPGFSGWGRVSIGMERTKAEAALREAKITFETKTLHKTGVQLLTFTREDGWEGAVYFDEKDPQHVNQVGFTSRPLAEKDAKAFMDAVEKSLGKPARGYDRPEESRGEKVWKGTGASLGVSWSIHDGKWTVFETYHTSDY